ncbi:hypothetical protein SRHO_G00101090 [Serrasalmus rhombeus]
MKEFAVIPAKPDVHAFAKKSTTNSGRLTLTCLATGFYPKDVKLNVRKFQTSLPEHLLTSSGVRPNDDGTYQLRKSVEIQEDNTADYDCYVTHSTFEEPIITTWGLQKLTPAQYNARYAGNTCRQLFVQLLND